jgi:hypothetical protein
MQLVERQSCFLISREAVEGRAAVVDTTGVKGNVVVLLAEDSASHGRGGGEEVDARATRTSLKSVSSAAYFTGGWWDMIDNLPWMKTMLGDWAVAFLPAIFTKAMAVVPALVLE